MAQHQLGQNSMQGLAARQVPDLCEIDGRVIAASQHWENWWKTVSNLDLCETDGRVTGKGILVFYTQSTITVISGRYTFCRYTINIGRVIAASSPLWYWWSNDSKQPLVLLKLIKSGNRLLAFVKFMKEWWQAVNLCEIHERVIAGC